MLIFIFLAYVYIADKGIALRFAGTVFAYGVTSSGKTHTMHVSYCEVLSYFSL